VPQNRTEGFVFTVLMVGLMVVGMDLYNQILHHGFGPGFAGGFVRAAVPAFGVAMVLSLAFVNRTARWLTVKTPINHASRGQVIAVTTAFMMTMMVVLMSGYATMVNTGPGAGFWVAWASAVGLNIAVALPLQYLVVGPASRLVLRRIQTGRNRS
jgi:hypothetical protein